MRPFFVALALLAASCSSPFEPADLAGSYAADLYAGRAVPFSYHDGERTINVIADSIILHADGTGRRGGTWEVTEDDVGTTTLVHFTGDLAYTIRGSTIEVRDLCAGVCDLAFRPPLEYLIIGNALVRDDSRWVRRN